jgi:hypothetical protein
MKKTCVPAIVLVLTSCILYFLSSSTSTKSLSTIPRVRPTTSGLSRDMATLSKLPSSANTAPDLVSSAPRSLTTLPRAQATKRGLNRAKGPAPIVNPCIGVSESNREEMLQCKSMTGPNGAAVCCCDWIATGKQLWGCYPSLFIAGAQKAGTTALTALLSYIPHIALPQQKELHMLSSTMRHTNYLNLLHRQPQNHSGGLALFTFDATPKYMLSATTIKEMARVAPLARVIVMVCGSTYEKHALPFN